VQVHELLTDRRELWRGPVRRVRFDPAEEPAAVYHVTPRGRASYADPSH